MGMEQSIQKQQKEEEKGKKDQGKFGILNAKIMATYRKCKKRGMDSVGEEEE
jgi:hypothetical protein